MEELQEIVENKSKTNDAQYIADAFIDKHFHCD